MLPMGVEIRLDGVSHRYPATEESAEVTALAEIDLRIAAGEMLVLMGPSGSGKSTLLNLIGAVDRPTGGRLMIGDLEVSRLGEDQLTQLRRHRVGFIFQAFNLLPTLDVSENVAFPLALAAVSPRESGERVEALLESVGLSHRRHHFPNQLSGGEMQRVAIARAIIHRPDLILADEPTGNLDLATGDQILELIAAVHRQFAPTVVIATHSERAARLGERIITLADGRLAGEARV
jgi:putative ABC transport system ATP-binding protein